MLRDVILASFIIILKPVLSCTGRFHASCFFLETLYKYLLVPLLTDYNNYDLTLVINTRTTLFSFVLCTTLNVLKSNTLTSCLLENEQQSPWVLNVTQPLATFPTRQTTSAVSPLLLHCSITACTSRLYSAQARSIIIDYNKSIICHDYTSDAA